MVSISAGVNMKKQFIVILVFVGLLSVISIIFLCNKSSGDIHHEIHSLKSEEQVIIKYGKPITIVSTPLAFDNYADEVKMFMSNQSEYIADFVYVYENFSILISTRKKLIGYSVNDKLYYIRH